MLRIRATFWGSLTGPLISLALLWVGVAIPVLDCELAHDSSPVVTDAGSPGPNLSHDHRLCLLFQSSPGWAPSSPVTPDVSVVHQEERPWLLSPWIPGNQRTPALARAPPFQI